MVTRGLGRALTLLGGLAVGCGEEASSPTEIVLVVTSNLRVPQQLDGVRVEATGPDGRMQRATAQLTGGATLPVSVRLAHRDGALGPLRIEVHGEREGHDVVVRSAQLAFAPDQRRILALALLEQCLGVSCFDGLTCTESGCAAPYIAASDLPLYDGPTFRALGAPVAAAYDLVDGGQLGLDGESYEPIVPDPDAGALDAAEDAGSWSSDAGPQDAGAADCPRELVCRGLCFPLPILGFCECKFECVPSPAAPAVIK
jgi:hypothetical protein